MQSSVQFVTRLCGGSRLPCHRGLAQILISVRRSHFIVCLSLSLLIWHIIGLLNNTSHRTTLGDTDHRNRYTQLDVLTAVIIYRRILTVAERSSLCYEWFYFDRMARAFVCLSRKSSWLLFLDDSYLLRLKYIWRFVEDADNGIDENVVRLRTSLRNILCCLLPFKRWTACHKWLTPL